jgi:hypothetical protein
LPGGEVVLNFPVRRNGIYYLGEGREYPSVTEVLRVINKPLTQWAARTAASLVLADPFTYNTAEKAAAGIYAQRDEAATRGTLVHGAIASHFAGQDHLVPEDLRGYYRAFSAWMNSTKCDLIYSETICFSDTHRYAGTLDLMVAISNEPYIVDFKTSRSVYPEYLLQVAAYCHAEGIWVNGKSIPMPDVPIHGMVVLLQKTGDYVVRRVQNSERAFAAFVAARELYDYMREEGAL